MAATFDLTTPSGSVGKFVWYLSADGTALQIALSDGSPLPPQVGSQIGNYIEGLFRYAADQLSTASNILGTVDPTLSQTCASEAAAMKAMAGL